MTAVLRNSKIKEPPMNADEREWNNATFHVNRRDSFCSTTGPKGRKHIARGEAPGKEIKG